ncbi:MAG TPA: hypothetical protein VD997_13810 [Phycisphaerales bacterium]|nr:hypothetical protein [Phycisphaerales bacterium]
MHGSRDGFEEGVCEQLVSSAGGVLDQCEGLIRAMPEGVFGAESRAIRGGTFGKHLRHTLDHFHAALAVVGMIGPDPDSEDVIDYDHRRRNTPIENDKHLALDAIDELRIRLAGAASEGLCRPVRVRVMIDGDGAEVELASTLGRELAFATHHAVHHMAMMKAIAQEFGVEADDAFGKAPSTVHAERGRAA